MTGLELLVSHLVKLGLVALLVGMSVRGRILRCWTFFVYVVAVLLGNSLSTLLPALFFNASFWTLKQGVYDVLKAAIAIELAARAFAAFPGAWRTARAVLAALLGASTVWVAWLTPRSYEMLWEWQPRAVTAAVWLLTATALLVVFYQVPIGDWQRAILLGYAPYLLVFVTAMSVLRRHGWAAREGASLLDATGYLAVVLFWAWAAWRRDDTPALDPARPAGGAR